MHGVKGIHSRQEPSRQDINELKTPSLETLKITGPENALLVNTRPAFKRKDTILLHFRELEGLPAEVKISTSVPGQSIHKITEVNAMG